MRAPEFWARNGAAAHLLAPLGAAYGLAGRLRFALARPLACGVPVICIGNLVAGGAGKTPVTLAIAKHLTSRGTAVHCLTRGYGGRAAGPLRVDPSSHGAAEVGDEALLLAAAAPAWVARDRRAGVAAAVEAGAAAVVMDDGFQNPSLVKDLALLVVDGAYGFGNGRVMPAGPLRETLARGLSRAHGVILMGDDSHRVRRRLGDLPLLRADLTAASSGPDLKGRRILAFAGIARPAKFFETLANLGAEVVETRGFPDHHPYTAGELHRLLAHARSLGALPVTTEKDATRLPADIVPQVASLPVEVTWRDPDLFQRLLERVVAGPEA